MIDTLFRILFAFIAVGLLATLLLLLDARMRGWRRMAAKFRTTGPPAGRIPTRQDGDVGGVGLLQLRGFCLAAVDEAGLYFAAPRLFRHTHPPLLFPWDQLALREDRTLLGRRIVRLSVGRVHLGFLTLRGGVANEVRDRML